MKYRNRFSVISFDVPVFILFFAIASFAVESMVIDSCSGSVEIKRAGQSKWVVGKKGEKLFNNDLLRTQAKSWVRFSDGKGSTVIMREHSQIRINLFSSRGSNLVSKHVTMFFGAMFYTLKHAAPRALTMREDVKIYSPTAVLAVRGTSFSIEVDKKDGSTMARVIEGTVLVRNILQNTATFLGAPYQAHITVHTEKVNPQPVLDEDVKQLSTWVPKEIIDKIKTIQLEQSRRDRRIIVDKFEDRIVIMPFANLSEYGGVWDIGSGFSGLIAKEISDNNRGLEVVIDGSPVDNPLQAGIDKKSRFVVAGSIERFDIVQYAQVSVKADAYSEFSIARVQVKIQLVDVDAQAVVYEGTLEGEVSGKNIEQNTWTEIGKLAFDMDDRKFADSILGKAVAQALEPSSETIGKYLHY